MLARELTAPLPATLWVELTSRCPFDCMFCSRKQERGAGEHMPIELYRSLIAQLEQPEIIRLNYSGESTHHPHLAEAIRLARATGATTELVSALSSATPAAVESMVESGLHRLSISVHTLDEAEYHAIYGFGSVAALRSRIELLEAAKLRRGTRFPELDFAFVALDTNLSQLARVTEWANQLGISQISVHPVIRRSQILHQFPAELDSRGELRPDFSARIHAEAARLTHCYPRIAISVARPETPALAAAGLTTCGQNPWETVHVLSNGSVVVCEVQDRTVMGSLVKSTLAQIWNSPAYTGFRAQYINGQASGCRTCAWRVTAPPGSLGATLIRGFHSAEGEMVWSTASASLVMRHELSAKRLSVSGILPPGPPGSPNQLTIRPAGGVPAQVTNATGDLLSFQIAVVLPKRGSRDQALTFQTAHRFCPAERGSSSDLRQLGFALCALTAEADLPREQAIDRLLLALHRAGHLARLWPKVTLPARPDRPGITVLIPERESPELLAGTLEAACQAASALTEPVQLLVIASGSRPRAYAGLLTRFPGIQFHFRPHPLPFLSAVALGLRNTVHSWVYLLNSDMRLDPDALSHVLPLRAPGIFAIASRIEMEDGTDRETGWTALRRSPNAPAELVEQDPSALTGPQECLYAGGGSSLFRTALLRKLVRRSRCYEPFYFEDAEWGVAAARRGYRTLFSPQSHAVHGHRRTVSRFYPEQEIARIFERNRILFHLRNLDNLPCLKPHLFQLDPQSWRELTNFRTLTGLMIARSRI